VLPAPGHVPLMAKLAPLFVLSWASVSFHVLPGTETDCGVAALEVTKIEHRLPILIVATGPLSGLTVLATASTFVNDVAVNVHVPAVVTVVVADGRMEFVQPLKLTGLVVPSTVATSLTAVILPAMAVHVTVIPVLEVSLDVVPLTILNA